jgi:hypothetical protein
MLLARADDEQREEHVTKQVRLGMMLRFRLVIYFGFTF